VIISIYGKPVFAMETKWVFFGGGGGKIGTDLKLVFERVQPFGL